MKNIFIIAAVTTSFCMEANAQQPWTLRDCIDHALAHNVDVLRAEVSASQSRVEVSTARWARLPNLDANANQSFSWGRTQTAVKDADTGDYTTKYVDAGSRGSNLSISTFIPILTGGELPHQYALSKLNFQAALADLEKAREDVSVNVTSAFLQVLYDRELLRVAEKQAQLSKMQYARIEALEQVGRASAAEVAEARARVAQDELSVVEAENTRRLALLDLAQLIELDSPENFEVEAPADGAEAVTLDTPELIFLAALSDKPQVKAAQARLEGSRHNIKLAQSAAYPSLSLTGSLGTSYYSTLNRTFSEQLGDNFNRYVGLSLRIPLFNRFATRNRVRTARLQHRDYALQLDAVKKALYKEIQQAWYAAVAAEKKWRSGVAAREASEASFAQTARSYEEGRATGVAFQEARQSLLKAESEELQAKYEYLFRTKLLDFYRGKDLR